MHAGEPLELPTDVDHVLEALGFISSLPIGVKNGTCLEVRQGSDIDEFFANILCSVGRVLAKFPECAYEAGTYAFAVRCYPDPV